MDFYTRNDQVLRPVSNTDLYCIPGKYMSAKLLSTKVETEHSVIQKEIPQKLSIIEVMRIKNRRFLSTPCTCVVLLRQSDRCHG